MSFSHFVDQENIVAFRPSAICFNFHSFSFSFGFRKVVFKLKISCDNTTLSKKKHAHRSNLKVEFSTNWKKQPISNKGGSCDERTPPSYTIEELQR